MSENLPRRFCGDCGDYMDYIKTDRKYAINEKIITLHDIWIWRCPYCHNEIMSNSAKRRLANLMIVSRDRGRKIP